METKCDVLIVGAGVAGLSAARELLKHVPTLNVLVIEAKDRVGGRTMTIDLKTANGTDRWDIGGQWVGSTQKHVIKLLKELKLSTYQQYSTGTKLAQVGSTAIRPYTSTPPSGKDLRYRRQVIFKQTFHFILETSVLWRALILSKHIRSWLKWLKRLIFATFSKCPKPSEWTK
jgi:phytoene dehydrogenase-like protein